MGSPCQINALSWRVAAAVAERVPDVQVFHLHPGGGQYDVLSLQVRGVTLADLNRNGRIFIAGSTPLEWDDVLSDGGDACVSSIVANAPHAGDTSDRQTPRVTTYRMIATLLERLSREDDSVRWDVEAAMFDASNAVFVRTEYLFGQRLLIDADPYEVWCLKANGEPVLSVYDGHGWTSSGSEFHWESCNHASVDEALELMRNV